MKSLEIWIDVADLRALKAAGDRLCFASQVEGTFNVVWRASDNYLANNVFRWADRYDMFGAGRFLDGALVLARTDQVPIQLGERATLDPQGRLGDASTGGPAGGITFVDDYGPINPALGQLSIGIDGTEESTPIYVSEGPISAGDYVMRPVERVLAWFEPFIETGTMFRPPRPMAVEVDMTGVDSQARLFRDGTWSRPTEEEAVGFRGRSAAVDGPEIGPG